MNELFKDALDRTRMLRGYAELEEAKLKYHVKVKELIPPGTSPERVREIEVAAEAFWNADHAVRRNHSNSSPVILLYIGHDVARMFSAVAVAAADGQGTGLFAPARGVKGRNCPPTPLKSALPSEAAC